MNNSLKVQMTDELYSMIETGQAGQLNIINNFFTKIKVTPSRGGSINEIEYFEPNNKLLVEILETKIISEADRDNEEDYGNDYKSYVAVESGSEKVHFIDSCYFGYSNIPKFVGDSIFQKQIFPEYLVVIVDRQFNDSEEWPRYNIEIHKVDKKNLEEYFDKKLQEAKQYLKSDFINLNWFSRSLIKTERTGQYNLLRNLLDSELYRIDEATTVRINSYFQLEGILSASLEEGNEYYFGSTNNDKVFELWGKNLGYRIFSENLAGNLIVIATPTGNLDRNGCQGQKYSVTIYMVNKNHLVDMFNRKKAISERLPDVTLSDIVKSSASTKKFLYKYPQVFIRTGLFYNYGHCESPSYLYVNSKFHTTYNSVDDETVSLEDCNYRNEGSYDKETFERALKNAIGDRYAHQGYNHRAVVWALYNPEKVPEGWKLPKVIQ